MSTPGTLRRPKYATIARQLREQMRSGELRCGDRLPSYAEMKARGVSQPTLDRVYGLLENDGLIEKRHGSGVFVTQHQKHGSKSRRAQTGILGYAGVVNNSDQHPYGARVLSGAQDAAHEAGFDLLLFRDAGEVRWELLDGLFAFGYGGVAVAGKRPEPMPCVAVLARGVNIPYVTTDDFHALQTLTEHFIELGHRRIAYLFAEQSARVEGYQAALREAGIELQANWMRPYIPAGEMFDRAVNFVGYGERAMTQWLREDWKKTGCTALLCHNDEVAAGVLRALPSAKIRVPHDVSVAGFDGLKLTEHTSPPLTTMQAPLYEIGARGIGRLLQQMNEEAAGREPHELLLPANLVVRASSAPSPT